MPGIIEAYRAHLPVTERTSVPPPEGNCPPIQAPDPRSIPFGNRRHAQPLDFRQIDSEVLGQQRAQRAAVGQLE